MRWRGELRKACKAHRQISRRSSFGRRGKRGKRACWLDVSGWGWCLDDMSSGSEAAGSGGGDGAECVYRRRRENEL